MKTPRQSRNIKPVTKLYYPVKKDNYSLKNLKKKKTTHEDEDTDSENDHDHDHDHDLDMKDMMKNPLLSLLTGSSFSSLSEKKIPDVYAKDNHIYFRTEIRDQPVRKLVELITAKNEEYDQIKKHNMLIKNYEPKPIYLHITSPGGCIFNSFIAVDAIQNSKIPVHTIIEGYAASGGTVMAAVGARRYMTSSAQLLIHQLSSGFHGTMAEIEDDFNNSKLWMSKIRELYKTHSKMSYKTIDAQLKHDLWWDANKSIDVGLVDEIWTGEN